MCDRVLRDLTENVLFGTEELLDLGAAVLAAFRAHVAAVQHSVLRRRDVDECCFHARKDVLDSTLVDVAVDLGYIIARARHIVLDQRSSFEDRDLGRFFSNGHAHHVSARWSTVALATLTKGERLFVELDGVAGERGYWLSGVVPPTIAAPASTAASTTTSTLLAATFASGVVPARIVVAAVRVVVALILLLLVVLVAVLLATATTTAATSTTSTAAALVVAVTVISAVSYTHLTLPTKA